MNRLLNAGAWRFGVIWPWFMGALVFGIFAAARLSGPTGNGTSYSHPQLFMLLGGAAVPLFVLSVRLRALPHARRRVALQAMAALAIGLACMFVPQFFSEAWHPGAVHLTDELLWWWCGLVFFAVGVGMGARASLISREPARP